MTTPKKILVIDDEELLIRTMSKLLQREGYEVYTVKNAGDAEAMAEEEDFDLIISDIRMPGKNGVEIVKSIQNFLASNRKKKLPIIFVTGYADETIEEEAKKLSPLAYLYKPFDVHELIALVKNNI